VTEARRFLVRGIVQGVGFRPFVARLAGTHDLAGWVLNGGHGVEIHVEGRRAAIDAFAAALRSEAPPAARIVSVDAIATECAGSTAFLIRDSERRGAPTARISPDLPVCADCLTEMRDPQARRFEYPYINCTNCGPRFSIVCALPYDRERTTMAGWPLCAACAAEYRDRRDRRFHAEPVACPACGPRYRLVDADGAVLAREAPLARAAALLRGGALLAIKGVGGYHLACDAWNAAAVASLRERKYRKAKPFAVMAGDVATARRLVDMDAAAEALLTSSARPVVLVPARRTLPQVAPECRDLGVMLPYAPIHHLLFGAGAPQALVMTSANRSNEPIAFEDGDALDRLGGIADAFLAGDRPIARRLDDSVVRPGASGPLILRRGRGYAPGVVARLPAAAPILAVGADLKNTVTLVVRGEAIASQHIGDLEHLAAYDAFRATLRDLTAMYDVSWPQVVLAHDPHPHYASTAYALDLPASRRVAVQHHRAHIASVLAEREALATRVVGVAFDGTGYGDDGTIWGGEFLVGSVVEGFARAASLRPFPLAGGDAAARSPVQAAAGVLHGIDDLPDLLAPPFGFPDRYARARQLVAHGVRTVTCTSAGRLFDAVAALLGFTNGIEYEGQAAAWLEQLAWRVPRADPLPFELADVHLDLRAAVRAIVELRINGAEVPILARAFHETMAAAVAAMTRRLCEAHGIDVAVLSGGTFQNTLLVESIRRRLPAAVALWTNQHVPPNDGGISLGQAACAAVTLS
jgi:hydrogenase maturation protein HypF